MKTVDIKGYTDKMRKTLVSLQKEKEKEKDMDKEISDPGTLGVLASQLIGCTAVADQQCRDWSQSLQWNGGTGRSRICRSSSRTTWPASPSSSTYVLNTQRNATRTQL